MEQYYVMADLRRSPETAENLPPVPGAEVYAGKIKAVIEAKDRDEALAVGKTLITGCLKKGITAYQWTYMPVLDAQKMGDTAIYAPISNGHMADLLPHQGRSDPETPGRAGRTQYTAGPKN